MAYILAVYHDGGRFHTGATTNGNRIQLGDKICALLAAALQHLNDDLLAAAQGIFTFHQAVPGGAAVAASAHVVAHVGRPAKATQTAGGHGGGVAVIVHLQGSPQEGIDAVQAGYLRHGAVGAQSAVAAGKEDIAAGGGIFLHANLAAEGADAFDPARLNGGDQSGMGVQHPVAADLALKPQLLAVGGQQQLDGGAVKTDAVVQALYVVLGINALDDHHAHQDIGILDKLGIAGEKRFHGIGLVRRHNEIHPTAGDIYAGQILHDLIDLRNDDAALAGGGLYQGGGFLGAVSGKEVAFSVGLIRRHQAHIGDQVHKQAAVDLQICIKVPDFDLALGQHLAQPLGLGSGKGKIHRAGDAFFEIIQVLAAGNGGDDHGQIVNDGRVDFGQRSGQKGSLLLIISFQNNFIAGVDDRLQQFHDVFGRYCFSVTQGGGSTQPSLFGTALIIPGHCDRTTFHAY